MNKVAVKINLKANGMGWINQDDLANLHAVLKEHYVSNFRPNGLPAAGGNLDTIIEILLDVSFVDFFKIIRDGLIFDTVARGKDSFILKPLFDALGRLEQKNEAWDYTKVKFLFEDTEVIIYGMSNLFTSKIGTVFNQLSKCYHELSDNEMGNPYQIIIPLTKDKDDNGKEFFANYGGGGDFDIEAYQSYWGIVYNLGFDCKVYDVRKNKLLIESWDN